MALTPGQLQECMQKALKVALALEAKPSMGYNTTAVADAEIFSITPASGKYVHLILVILTVGTDGDRIEGQVYADGAWRTLFDPKLLGNTSAVLGFPNLKLDKIMIGTTEYTVPTGDGATKILRFMSRGTGPWNVTVLWYEA